MELAFGQFSLVPLADLCTYKRQETVFSLFSSSFLKNVLATHSNEWYRVMQWLPTCSQQAPGSLQGAHRHKYTEEGLCTKLLVTPGVDYGKVHF